MKRARPSVNEGGLKTETGEEGKGQGGRGLQKRRREGQSASARLGGASLLAGLGADHMT